MNLDLSNVILAYVHEDEKTATEAYRRYLRKRKAASEIWAKLRDRAAREKKEAGK